MNRNSLNFLKTVKDESVDFGGAVPDCDTCVIGESHQLAHPKTADNKVKRAFQLAITDLMGPTIPKALRYLVCFPKENVPGSIPGPIIMVGAKKDGYSPKQ